MKLSLSLIFCDNEKDNEKDTATKLMPPRYVLLRDLRVKLVFGDIVTVISLVYMYVVI